MKCLFLFNLLYCSLLVGAARPKYRFDYRYEKAFNSFYKLHQSATTWFEARIRCQAEGTELLVPDSLDEGDAVPLLVTAILTRFDGIFVGIHDLYSERSFVTIRGNLMLDTILNLLWEYKQPQHGGGRCVAMRRTGRIFTHPCESPLPFVCKINANDIEYRKECHTFDSNWKLGPNNTCYFLHLEPQTWYQAYATCLAAGGHLAILNNQTEADHIRNLYKHAGERRMPLNNFAFLGFSDLFQKHHYRTVHGERLEDLAFKDWKLHCSEARNASSAPDLRCGGILRSGLLTTGDCDTPAMFFCEKPANESTTTNLLRQGVSSEIDSSHLK